ncbi:MAG TPA: phosphate ABC transporter permease PstA [Planctomycetota bacterium]|nr:phosphate ABC transporter permease PstA [Planctomycetota bacterium]
MRTIQQTVALRVRQDRWFQVFGVTCTLLGVATLCALLGNLLLDGLGRIDWGFLSSFPSRFASKAGILAPLVGTLLVMLVTAAVAVPLGIAAGVYLEEYAPKNRITAIVEVNIANLAGVPSIIYGLMALGVFVYAFGFGHSILTAGLTLGCLILPIVIVATREALRTIPRSIREASYALGATKWETVRHHLLPYSTGGIATGIIIGLSRAIGETAPLVTIGALAYIAFLPDSPITTEFPFVSFSWLGSDFTVLPMQMFNWVSRPDPAFQANAAATGVVLILITLTMNALAIFVRYRMRRSIKW